MATPLQKFLFAWTNFLQNTKCVLNLYLVETSNYLAFFLMHMITFASLGCVHNHTCSSNTVYLIQRANAVRGETNPHHCTISAIFYSRKLVTDIKSLSFFTTNPSNPTWIKQLKATFIAKNYFCLIRCGPVYNLGQIVIGPSCFF